MSQAGNTPIQLYYSTTAAATPSAGNLAAGELAVNITDGKLFYKDNGGVVRVLATAAGSAGDVVGPGSSTDNALVRFDGTTGKLVQSSVGVLSDAGALSGLTSVAATTFTGTLTGNASTATTLQTSRTIWGQSFDGSANVTGALTGVTDLTASGSLTLNGGTANGISYLNASKVLTTGSALTFDGSTFGVAVSGSTDALRITQTGTGNAFVVEDSTSPDASPFVIDASGNTAVGSEIVATALSGSTPKFSVNGTTLATATQATTNWGNSATSPVCVLSKSRGGTTGVHTIVQSGDGLGAVAGLGSDGTNFVQSARIDFQVDGTPGTNDMPGRLVFSTTADGASTPTERMRIDSSGNVGIGTSSLSGKLHVAGQTRIQDSANAANYILIGSGANAPRGGNSVMAQTGSMVMGTEGAAPLIFITNAAEGMRLDSSGNLLVGTTSSTNARVRATQRSTDDVYRADIGTSGSAYVVIGSGSTMTSAYFSTSGGVTFAGQISSSGNTTSYATSSDYRLKENIQPMTGALAFVRKQRPVTYNWKANGSEGAGYIAHWMQEDGAGNCVTGTKDAVDADGKPVYQGIDTSFMVAPLNAAIDELADIVEAQAAIIEQLKADVAALKGA